MNKDDDNGIDEQELRARLMAERQVEAFLEIMRKRYGLDESEIPELLDNMKWVAKHRKTVSDGSSYAMLALLGIVVAGLATALWEGLKHMIYGEPK